MGDSLPKLTVRFFSTASGAQPVREWLNALEPEDRRSIGREIRTVQFGWPIGMPVVRKIEDGLWEVRVSLDRRIARVVFTIVRSEAVLVHGFIKKTRRFSAGDLMLARSRARQVRRAIEGGR